jgi:nucleotide-binding universal stress UspA family protein
MIEKILVTVAGLGQCEYLLKMMLDIPVVRRADITVLHVVPPQITTEQMADSLATGGKILAKAIEYLDLPPGKVKAMLVQGEPKDAVCQAVIDEKADLLIMGSRGMSRLESILSNSVSQYVFQLAACPMLLVKDEIYLRPPNRLMVAYDDSEPAKAALNQAISLLRENKNAQLILARVVADQKSADAITDLENGSKLKSAVALAKKMQVPYKCVLSVGKPGQEICRLADEYSVDMLILGSPDRRPSVAKNLPDLDRLLGNSISDYVRVNTPCPVLLARTQSKE